MKRRSNMEKFFINKKTETLKTMLQVINSTIENGLLNDAEEIKAHNMYICILYELSNRG